VGAAGGVSPATTGIGSAAGTATATAVYAPTVLVRLSRSAATVELAGAVSAVTPPAGSVAPVPTIGGTCARVEA
jgi:hypothetical protein